MQNALVAILTRYGTALLWLDGRLARATTTKRILAACAYSTLWRWRNSTPGDVAPSA